MNKVKFLILVALAISGKCLEGYATTPLSADPVDSISIVSKYCVYTSIGLTRLDYDNKKPNMVMKDSTSIRKFMNILDSLKALRPFEYGPTSPAFKIVPVSKMFVVNKGPGTEASGYCIIHNRNSPPELIWFVTGGKIIRGTTLYEEPIGFYEWMRYLCGLDGESDSPSTQKETEEFFNKQTNR